MSAQPVRRTRSVARLRRFWIVIAFGVALTIGAAAFAVTWPGFDPRDVTVSGNRIVARDEILKHARVSMRINMWLQSPGAIASRIETIPYVASATVHRLPPGTVAVSVVERVPFAVLSSGSRTVLIDRDLRVLTETNESAAPPALPRFAMQYKGSLDPGVFIDGSPARTLRDDYDAFQTARVPVARLAFDRFGGLVATMPAGTRILLGDDTDLAKKLALIDPILSQVVHKERSVAALDLRAPSAPVVVYK